LSFLKLISSIINVFQIRQVAFTWDLNRLDEVILSRTRENGDLEVSFNHVTTADAEVSHS